MQFLDELEIHIYILSGVWRFSQRCNRNQITDVITAGGHVHESDLFTSGGRAFPLCALYNYIMTFLY